MQYFLLTFKHKWFVFQAGRKVGVSFWRLLIHDWTKFLPSELPHYQRQFFGKKDDPEGFARAWLHHQNSHDHHWEWWIPRTGHTRSIPPYPDNVPLIMSDQALLEMIADWMGASRAYDGQWPRKDQWVWRDKQLPKILPRLHPITAQKVLHELNMHRLLSEEQWEQLYRTL